MVKWRMTTSRMIPLAALLALTVGCKGGQPTGAERGACFPNKTCNAGLTCLSGVCVSVPDDFCKKGKVVGRIPPAPAPGKMLVRLEEYKRKAAALEAEANLKKLKAGARAFFVSDHYDQTGTLQPRTFPPGGTDWTPPDRCCQQNEGRCTSGLEVWGEAPWRALRFGIHEPHRYQYRFTSQGLDREATFTVQARGDLDCDGVFSLYTITGSVDAEYNVVIRGPDVQNRLE